jgi:cell division protein FtsZ
MQSMSNEDAYKREIVPGQRAGKSDAQPDVYEEQQEDQWAVLRHEVEVDDMTRQDERVRSGWGQRDTEDDAIPSQTTLNDLEEAGQHVNIIVAGVGGGGMNAVNRMIDTQVRGVRFIAMNTDSQVLDLSPATSRICLGQHYTQGLGAGGNASVGMRAATESTAEIRAALGEADLIFIAAGLGGGTGTGAAPVVASIAKKLGALTIGIVTLPFTFEGTRRKRIAEDGLAELGAEVDALIIVPNDRLLSVTGRDRSLSEAFKFADDVLRQGVQGIAEVINVPGMVNVDFADVRTVLRDAGTALMSIGQGKGRNRAQLAAEEAVAGGFLNVSIRGAKRVLFNISGGEDMTLFEVNEVAECIGKAIDDTADITFGAVVDPMLKDSIRVTLIAAGMDEPRLTSRPQMSRADQHRSPSFGSMHATPAVPAMSPVPPSVQSVPPVTPLPPMSPVASPPVRPANINRNEQPGVVPAKPPGPPARPQRSLDDLRGIRSMGRRQDQENE